MKKENTVRASAKRSGERLAQNGNRLLLIEALLVCLLFVPLYMLLSTALSAILILIDPTTSLPYPIMAIFGVLFFAIALFLVLPTLLGFCAIAERVAHDRKTVLADLFCFFASRDRYFAALSLSARFLWKLTLCITAVRLTVMTAVLFLPDTVWSTLLCALLIAAEILAGIVWELSGFPLLYLLLCREEEEWAEGAILFCAPALCALRFFGGFLPQLLLGLLTCGVLLVADTLPRMAVAYFAYCDSFFKGNRDSDSMD